MENLLGPANGYPPDEMRCKGISQTKRKAGLPYPENRCIKWATVASNHRYCRTHGGSKNRKRTYKAMSQNSYSKYVGPNLQAKLKELSGISPAERNSLKDEVDFTRILATESLACFDASMAEGVPDSMKVKASMIARNALESVAKMVERAAKVNALSEKTIDFEYIDFVTNQFTRIVERHVSEFGQDVIDKINEDIKAIKLPDRLNADLTEDQRRDKLRKMLEDMEGSV
jgi:hypothetical protein